MNSRRVPPAYWVACMFVVFLVMVGLVSILILITPIEKAMSLAFIVGAGLIALSFGLAAK